MEEREDIQETGNRFADGLLMPIFAVGAVFLFIVLCFYAYNNVMKNKNNSDQVIILDGDEGGFKVAPADPGGMEVEHTDKEVFNTVTGQQENIENGDVKVESAEAPVTQDQLAANATEGTSSDVPEVPEQSAAVPAPQEGQLIIASEGGKSEITKTEEAKSEEPASAVIESVMPSDENVPSEVAITDPFANNNEKQKDSPSPAVMAEEPVNVPSPEAEVKTSAKPEKKAEPTAVKTEIKKETDKKTGESKTVIEFKAKPKSMGGGEATKSSTVAGSYYVQVSSHSSRSEATAAWLKFIKAHSDDVGGKSNNITEADVNGKKFYRLSFGPFADRSDASTKCGILKAKGQDCIVQKY